MAHSRRIVVIGAGIGGLTAALTLAARGCEVVVVERAAAPGGKMRELTLAGLPLDVGPTVLTMAWVFEEIFADIGERLSDHIVLTPLDVLARHAWSATERLDLYADVATSAEAIGQFAGPREAEGYLAFCARARATYETLEKSFIRAAKPSPFSLVAGAGLRGLADLARISPFTSLWRALSDHFQDPRLRQLFGRYATYCGSSPFLAPATLMLVAHVEQRGVWLVQGGMHRLARALAELATRRGALFRYGVEVREIMVRDGRVSGVRLAHGEIVEAPTVVVNADPAAVADGILGHDVQRALPRLSPSARSLSAMTWALVAETDGFPLHRHTVFFSRDYAAEFADILRRDRLPSEPTVYVCAHDRGGESGEEYLRPLSSESGPDSGLDSGKTLGTRPTSERLFFIVNAPSSGDRRAFSADDIQRCEEGVFGLLARCGLTVRRPEALAVTTPADFERLFPGTGGALYGPASHGWTASFSRPTARTCLPGLYLAGGATHPGPGVPMAALSGRLAAAAVLADPARRL